MSTERLQDEVRALRQDVNTMGVRLTLAQSMLNFMMQAYDTLRGYGIDYRSLKEYEDDRILDEASEMPVSKAQQHIGEYLGRLTTALKAAVRRKGFKVH